MNEYRDHVEEALERRDLEAMKVFLQKGYEVVDVIEGGETALHFAACLGYADVVSTLIQSSEDVNAGRTPMVGTSLRKFEWTS